LLQLRPVQSRKRNFAVAQNRAALHKECAFQASSPKTFTAGRKTGLFFGKTPAMVLVLS
jgi:hypothetical protein